MHFLMGTISPPVSITCYPTSKILPNDPRPPVTHNVSKPALKVFGTMFHTSANGGGQGEIDWNVFLHAMTSMGFAAEKLFGSVWHFTPLETAAGSIHVHEPLPTGKIPFYMAGRIGGRLGRTYGWTGEMFTAD